MEFNTTKDAYIIAGQSNARGQAVSASASSQYKGTIRGVRHYDAFADRSHYLGNTAGSSQSANSAVAGKFGPEMALAVDIKAANGAPNILKYAVESTGLADHWLPPSGTEWLLFVSYMNNAITHFKKMKVNLNIKGFVWWQGEYDSQNEADANAYEANLVTLIAAVRSLVGNPTLPVLLVKLDNDDAGAYPYMDTVNDALAAVAGDHANAYLIDETPFSFNVDDPIHADAATQEAVSSALAAKFIEVTT